MIDKTFGGPLKIIELEEPFLDESLSCLPMLFKRRERRLNTESVKQLPDTIRTQGANTDLTF